MAITRNKKKEATKKVLDTKKDAKKVVSKAVSGSKSENKVSISTKIKPNSNKNQTQNTVQTIEINIVPPKPVRRKKAVTTDTKAKNLSDTEAKKVAGEALKTEYSSYNTEKQKAISLAITLPPALANVAITESQIDTTAKIVALTEELRQKTLAIRALEQGRVGPVGLSGARGGYFSAIATPTQNPYNSVFPASAPSIGSIIGGSSAFGNTGLSGYNSPYFAQGGTATPAVNSTTTTVSNTPVQPAVNSTTPVDTTTPVQPTTPAVNIPVQPTTPDDELKKLEDETQASSYTIELAKIYGQRIAVNGKNIDELSKIVAELQTIQPTNPVDITALNVYMKILEDQITLLKTQQAETTADDNTIITPDSQDPAVFIGPTDGTSDEQRAKAEANASDKKKKDEEVAKKEAEQFSEQVLFELEAYQSQYDSQIKNATSQDQLRTIKIPIQNVADQPGKTPKKVAAVQYLELLLTSTEPTLTTPTLTEPTLTTPSALAPEGKTLEELDLDATNAESRATALQAEVASGIGNEAELETVQKVALDKRVLYIAELNKQKAKKEKAEKTLAKKAEKAKEAKANADRAVAEKKAVADALAKEKRLEKFAKEAEKKRLEELVVSEDANLEAEKELSGTSLTKAIKDATNEIKALTATNKKEQAKINSNVYTEEALAFEINKIKRNTKKIKSLRAKITRLEKEAGGAGGEASGEASGEGSGGEASGDGDSTASSYQEQVEENRTTERSASKAYEDPLFPDTFDLTKNATPSQPLTNYSVLLHRRYMIDKMISTNAFQTLPSDKQQTLRATIRKETKILNEFLADGQNLPAGVGQIIANARRAQIIAAGKPFLINTIGVWNSKALETIRKLNDRNVNIETMASLYIDAMGGKLAP